MEPATPVLPDEKPVEGNVSKSVITNFERLCKNFEIAAMKERLKASIKFLHTTLIKDIENSNFKKSYETYKENQKQVHKQIEKILEEIKTSKTTNADKKLAQSVYRIMNPDDAPEIVNLQSVISTIDNLEKYILDEIINKNSDKLEKFKKIVEDAKK